MAPNSGENKMHSHGQQSQSGAISMRAGSIPPGQGHNGLTPQQQQQLQLHQQQQAAMHNQQMGNPATPSFPDTTKFVLDYLKKKGFSRTEAELRLESAQTVTPLVTLNNPVAAKSGLPSAAMVSRSMTVAGGSIPIGGPIAGPMGRPKTDRNKRNINWRAYQALSEWTDNSLDLYQPELRRVLYPVFVHLYLNLVSQHQSQQAKEFFQEFAPSHSVLHSQDLQKLSAVLLPSHLTDNELAKVFRSDKYSIKVSRTTFDLLVYFLDEIEEDGGSIITQIINQYIKANITSARPSRFDNEVVMDPEEGLPGLLDGQTELDAFNSQPVKLGKLPLDPDFEKDVEMILEHQDNEAQAMNQGLQSPNSGSLLSEFQKMNEKEVDSPARSLLPLPQYKTADILNEIRAVSDSKNKIKVGPIQSALPSVCMYTFQNTQHNLNNLTFSNDSTLVAGGFADSFVKIWSLKGEKLQGVLQNDESAPYKRLVGHSGAVYGLSFSPDNRFLLSSSEDKTVRLWSMDTYSALVSYKGHNHPVWDVAFGPFGHYFATASNDQTARLWSCDHICPIRIFAGHLSDVDTVSFHPNGTYLVTGSSDKTCRMWDINRGSSVRVFPGHTGPVTCTAISPDGRWLATAGEDSVIHVWDLGSARRLKSMKGHGKCSIYSLAFSKEGGILVSSGSDCTVRVWDIRKNTGDQGPEPEIYSAVVGGGPTSVNGTSVGNNLSSAGSGGSASNSGLGGNRNDHSKLDLDGRRRKDVAATADHMVVYNTKKTPVYKVQFTNRNLCIAGGAFNG